MKLVQGSDQLFDIEWRFARPGAKLLGRPTVFDSSVWDWDQKGPSGPFAEQLGEQTERSCPARWYRRLGFGHQRGPDGQGQPHGDASWWVNGVPSAALFQHHQPAIICGQLPWMGRGLGLSGDICQNSFGVPGFMRGAGVGLGGEGVFEYMLTCCWPIHGLATVALSGVGVFEYSPPEFIGSGGFAMDGEGIFEYSTAGFIGSGGVELGGDGFFTCPPFCGTGGIQLGGDGFPDLWRGTGGVEMDGAGIFTCPPFCGDGGPALDGEGLFLYALPPEFIGTGGIELSGDGFPSIWLGTGGVELGGEEAFALAGLVGTGGVELGGEEGFDLAGLVGTGGVGLDGEGEFEYSLV